MSIHENINVTKILEVFSKQNVLLLKLAVAKHIKLTTWLQLKYDLVHENIK